MEAPPQGAALVAPALARPFDDIAPAPVFRPTAEEWADPFAYIARIQHAALEAGICTIVPPVTATANPEEVFSKVLSSFTAKWQLIKSASWAEMRDGTQPGTRAPEKHTLPAFKEDAQKLALAVVGTEELPTPERAEAVFWATRGEPGASTARPGTADANGAAGGAANGGGGAVPVGEWACGASNLEGSAFDAASGCPLGSSRWNLGSLSSEPGSVLRHLGHTIPGATHPTLSVGMAMTATPWHVADHYLCSVGYLHAGAAHTWYGVPAHSADKFEEVVEGAMYPCGEGGSGGSGDVGVGPGSAADAAAAAAGAGLTARERTDRSLHALLAKRCMFHPRLLAKHGVKAVRAVQHAGEFIVSFPRAYSCGFAHGFHVSETVALCARDWFPFGADASARYSRLRIMPRMDFDMLLCQESLDIAQAMFAKPSGEMLSSPGASSGCGSAGGAAPGSGSASSAPASINPNTDLTTLLLFCSRVRTQHRRCAALAAQGARVTPMADESAGTLCSTCYGVCGMANVVDDASPEGGSPGGGNPRCVACRMRDGGAGAQSAESTVYVHPTAGVYEAWCRVMEPAVQLVEDGLLRSLVPLGVSESARFGDGDGASALPKDSHPWAWVELCPALSTLGRSDSALTAPEPAPPLASSANTANNAATSYAPAAATSAATLAPAGEPGAQQPELVEEQPPPPPKLQVQHTSKPSSSSGGAGGSSSGGGYGGYGMQQRGSLGVPVAMASTSAPGLFQPPGGGSAGGSGGGEKRGVRKAALAAAAANREAAQMTEAVALREAARSSYGGGGGGRSGHGSGHGGGHGGMPTGAGGPITMKNLVDVGLLTPGQRVLKLEYKGRTYHADLDVVGHITYDDMLFASPSAFSVYIKRLVTPTRKADDGWKSVRFAGKLLEHFKLKYSEGGAGAGLARRPAGASHSAGAQAGRAPQMSPQPPRPRGRPPGSRRDASPPPPPPPTASQLAAAAAAYGEPQGKRQRRTNVRYT